MSRLFSCLVASFLFVPRYACLLARNLVPPRLSVSAGYWGGFANSYFSGSECRNPEHKRHAGVNLRRQCSVTHAKYVRARVVPRGEVAQDGSSSGYSVRFEINELTVGRGRRDKVRKLPLWVLSGCFSAVPRQEGFGGHISNCVVLFVARFYWWGLEKSKTSCISPSVSLRQRHTL